LPTIGSGHGPVQLELDLVLDVGGVALGRSGQHGGFHGERGVLQDVDAAEPGGGVLERLGERVMVEDARGERCGGDALGGELADETVELLAVAGDQGDVEAL
jgi:hypothetical protein